MGFRLQRFVIAIPCRMMVGSVADDCSPVGCAIASLWPTQPHAIIAADVWRLRSLRC
jgi:hypothetical protein